MRYVNNTGMSSWQTYWRLGRLPRAKVWGKLCWEQWHTFPLEGLLPRWSHLLIESDGPIYQSVRGCLNTKGQALQRNKETEPGDILALVFGCEWKTSPGLHPQKSQGSKERGLQSLVSWGLYLSQQCIIRDSGFHWGSTLSSDTY